MFPKWQTLQNSIYRHQILILMLNLIYHLSFLFAEIRQLEQAIISYRKCSPYLFCHLNVIWFHVHNSTQGMAMAVIWGAPCPSYVWHAPCVSCALHASSEWRGTCQSWWCWTAKEDHIHWHSLWGEHKGYKINRLIEYDWVVNSNYKSYLLYIKRPKFDLIAFKCVVFKCWFGRLSTTHTCTLHSQSWRAWRCFWHPWWKKSCTSWETLR